MNIRPSRTSKHTSSGKNVRGLHVVALIEGAKGLLVLMVGFGLLSFIHKDVDESAMHLVEHFHLSPTSHYPRIFLDLAEHITETKLWYMALAAIIYSVVRIIEAIGLWLRKTWAEWFAVLTGSLYIPVEIFEVIRRVTWQRVTVLSINVVVVAYLLFVLIQNGSKEQS
jgi:uncharacterized membrane protein (DUF2068 family)